MIFVEVIDRRGRVLSRSRVETLPFRIGRAYDADLILDDPHVSPLHAVVERDAEGRLRLRDADSRNGIALEGGRERLPAVTLDGDAGGDGGDGSAPPAAAEPAAGAGGAAAGGDAGVRCGGRWKEPE